MTNTTGLDDSNARLPSPQAPVQAAVIDVDNVSKWYGDVVAVNGVTVQVLPGITGLLGPNGAGKTTLLHLIAGLAGCSEGAVKVLGEPVRDNPELYHRIGVMTEKEGVYGFYTGRQFLESTARMRGLSPIGPAVDRAVEIVAMTEFQNRRLGTYSRGMRQRMRLAAALLHDPEVLVLDEPLSGTDPRQRLEFHEAMTRFADEGRTVLVSSHILEEVEILADRIVLMVSGKVAASGDILAIREKLDEQAYKVRIVTDSPRAVAAALVRLEEVDSVNIGPDGDLVVLSRYVGVLQETIPRVARQLEARLFRVEPLDESLESIFGYVVER